MAMGWHNKGSTLHVLPSTSYINYSVLRKACPFSVPLLAMVNSTWSWLLSAIRMTPARPVIRVIPLSYTPDYPDYSGLLRTYGHGSECLIDGPWKGYSTFQSVGWLPCPMPWYAILPCYRLTI